MLLIISLFDEKTRWIEELKGYTKVMKIFKYVNHKMWRKLEKFSSIFFIIFYFYIEGLTTVIERSFIRLLERKLFRQHEGWFSQTIERYFPYYTRPNFFFSDFQVFWYQCSIWLGELKSKIVREFKKLSQTLKSLYVINERHLT